MTMNPGAGAHVLITGCTGFLGKIVLEELVRLRETVGLAQVYVLIRPKKGRTPMERFEHDLVPSPAFQMLPDGWWDCCTAVAADVSLPRLGLVDADWQSLSQSVTHIIHSAASIDFDLPLAEAANSNITGALQMLEFARACVRLERLVDVSTAYVTPHPDPGTTKVVAERIETMPFDVEAVYQSILDGNFDQQALIDQTGHPNTYTFTKCMAENLLAKRRGDVPLIIVRPSIISACLKYPFPGWIDSRAAFAGFVTLYGMGHLQVVSGELENHLDIVPCDEVAHRILWAAFRPLPADSDALPIRYAVAGMANSPTSAEIRDVSFSFFSERSTTKMRPMHIAPASLGLMVREWLQHRMPAGTAQVVMKMAGRSRESKDAKRLHDVLVYLNTAFPFFTTREFDFQATWPLDLGEAGTLGYQEVICQGVNRFLMRQEADQVTFAGKRHKDQSQGLLWVARLAHGNPMVRTLGLMAQNTFRRCLDSATFDEPAFQAGVAACKEGEGIILVPSHRSYFDFLLFPYLLLSRPDIGLPMPHIAATEDFAKLPVVGRMLQAAQAFYIRRGLGKPDPELAAKVQDLVRNRQAITFFIEGTRSRSRRFLSPRRGLLRALQQTGESFVVLPVAITYDRVPEEDVFVRELHGGAKARSGLKPLLNWLASLQRGNVRLGRAHIACGKPQRMGPDTDVFALGEAIRQELHTQTVSTTFHLSAFLAQRTMPGVTVAWLRHAIERRGGRVLESALKDGADLSPVVERTIQMHWAHWFIGDALSLAPDNPAIQQYAKLHGHPDLTPRSEPEDHRVLDVLNALFEPVCADFRYVATILAAELSQGEGLTRERVLELCHDAYRPDVEDAVADMVARGILQEEPDHLRWGANAEALGNYVVHLTSPWVVIGAPAIVSAESERVVR